MIWIAFELLAVAGAATLIPIYSELLKIGE